MNKPVIKSMDHQGLAVYQVGEGEPLFLFPYPHGATEVSMAQDRLCQLFAELGRQVITFDPPQAYRSKRLATCTLDEMISCAQETLESFGIKDPIDMVGHSMGGFCALAFSIERPTLVKSLMIICGNPGYKEVGNQWFTSGSIKGFDFLRLTFYGFKEIVGLGSMRNHKLLNNTLDYYLYKDHAYYKPRPLYPEDSRLKAPLRDRWMNQVRRENYSHRLGAIKVPTLILSGENDILSSARVNKKMAESIRRSELYTFHASGHYPHIEEENRFKKLVSTFYGSKVNN